MIRSSSFLTLAVLLSVGFIYPSFAQGPPSLYVEVKTTKLRTQAQHWSAGIAELNYGDKLEELKRDNQWVQVRTTSGLEGHVHLSAVTSRVVVITGKTSAADVPASSGDIVLAGKGFNKSLEDLAAAKAPTLDYKAVDKVEAWKVEAHELRAFLKEGKLADGRGLDG